MTAYDVQIVRSRRSYTRGVQDRKKRAGACPSPSGRRWPEGPDEGPFSPSPAASRHPLPEGEGRREKRVLHLRTGCNPQSAWITDERPFTWTRTSYMSQPIPSGSSIALIKVKTGFARSWLRIADGIHCVLRFGLNRARLNDRREL
jgi:hypothetical protein